ncbi:MAG: DUF5703 domain-containing protein, partial [Planctomycetia bacterium]
MKKLILVVWVVVSGTFLTVPPVEAAFISDSNVMWDSPSIDSQGSMPLGNGDIGINVWTENESDLVFYLGKTDAWDDNGSLLKLGKVRVSLPAGTFSASEPFLQEFRLQDGTIQIDAGQGTAAITVQLWVDPNNPVVQVDIQRASQFDTTVSIEPWRTARRELVDRNTDRQMAFGMRDHPPGTVFVEPDTIVSGETDRILWYHRNERSTWTENLTLQGLDPALPATGTDPLLHNTFGAAVSGTNLVNLNSTTLQTTQASTHQTISVHALTSQTDTAGQWIDRLDQQITQTESTSYATRKAANDQWWDAYNQKSYIRIT